MGRAAFREDVLNDWVLIVLESTIEILPIDTVSSDRELNVAEEFKALLSSGHRAPDLVPFDAYRLIGCTIEAAERVDLRSEALAIDNDITAEAIRWTTARESLVNLVKHKHEAILIVVLAVKGHLQLHAITLCPATWRHAHDGRRVDVLSGHCLGSHLRVGRAEAAVEF